MSISEPVFNAAVPTRSRPSDASQTEVFDFQVILDAVLGALSAQTGGLDAAERRHFVGDQAGVDTDHAVFQRLGNAEHTAQITRVEVGGQTEFGVVGHGNHFS